MTDNPPITTYANKSENKITFKIKTGYYLELWSSETMKLLGSTKNMIVKKYDSFWNYWSSISPLQYC